MKSFTQHRKKQEDPLKTGLIKDPVVDEIKIEESSAEKIPLKIESLTEELLMKDQIPKSNELVEDNIDISKYKFSKRIKNFEFQNTNEFPQNSTERKYVTKEDRKPKVSEIVEEEETLHGKEPIEIFSKVITKTIKEEEEITEVENRLTHIERQITKIFANLTGGGGSSVTGGDIQLSQVNDVNVVGIQDGQTLIWDQTSIRWVPGNTTGIDFIDELNDVDTTTNAPIINDILTYTANNVWEPQLAPQGFDGDYNSLTNQPTLFDGDYNSLTNQPTIPSALGSLNDVAFGVNVPMGDDVLTYTANNVWEPQAPSVGSTNLSQLSDVDFGMSGPQDGQILVYTSGTVTPTYYISSQGGELHTGNFGSGGSGGTIDTQASITNWAAQGSLPDGTVVYLYMFEADGITPYGSPIPLTRYYAGDMTQMHIWSIDMGDVPSYGTWRSTHFTPSTYAGQGMKFKMADGLASSGPSGWSSANNHLEGLSDVVYFGGVADGDVLTYVASSNTWRPEQPGGVGTGATGPYGGYFVWNAPYPNITDLPSASTYHGMFAHVHGTGKAYYSHSSAWLPLANETGAELNSPLIKDYAEVVNDQGTISGGGLHQVSLNDGNVITATISSNVEFDFTDVPSGCVSVTLIITSSGSSTGLTWSPGFKWEGNNHPALTANGVDIFSLMTVDQGTTWYGFTGGQNMS